MDRHTAEGAQPAAAGEPAGVVAPRPTWGHVATARPGGRARRRSVSRDQVGGAETDPGGATIRTRGYIPGWTGGDAVAKSAVEDDDYTLVQDGGGTRRMHVYINVGVDGQSTD